MIRIYSGSRCVEIRERHYNLYKLKGDRWEPIAPCNYSAAVDWINGLDEVEVFTISVFPFLAEAEMRAA